MAPSSASAPKSSIRHKKRSLEAPSACVKSQPTSGSFRVKDTSVLREERMAIYNFEREIRTPQSEAFVIEREGEEIGRVDLHYSGSTAYATLNVPADIDDDTIEELIGEIDERLVMSWEP